MKNTIYQFEAIDLAGKTIKLDNYRGKVLLIVNIASQCGLTSQLNSLQKVYEKYKERGFEILAFPSNDFNQEPKEGGKIEQFCSVNYGVQFKIFKKGKVKGKGAQPVYKFLADETGLLLRKNYPLWNFQKYLINRRGEVAEWFNPWRHPDSDKVTAAIEKCLDELAVENKK